MDNDTESIESFLGGFADYCRSKGHRDAKPLIDRAESLLEAEGIGVCMLDAGVPVEASLDELAEAVFRYSTDAMVKDTIWFRLLRDHTVKYHEDHSDSKSHNNMMKKYFPYGISETPARIAIDATQPRSFGNRSVIRRRTSRGLRCYSK